MKRSKRIEVLDRRPVNKDGFIDEWPEMGFVSMHSLYDPKPSVKIEDGIITPSVGAFYRIISALGMRVEVVKPVY